MAQYRQSVWTSATSDQHHLGIRIPKQQQQRTRRSGRSDKNTNIHKISIALLSIILILTAFSYYYISSTASASEAEADNNKAEFPQTNNNNSSSTLVKFGHGGSIAYNQEEEEEEEEEDDSQPHHPVGGLYNEAGRNELKHYEAQYEASLTNVPHLSLNNATDVDDEYDDGIDFLDSLLLQQNHDINHQNQAHPQLQKDQVHAHDAHTSDHHSASQTTDRVKSDSRHVNSINARSTKKSNTRRKSRHHKYSGSCQMKLLNSTAQLIEPLESKKFSRFSLQYTEVEERPIGEDQWEPRFAGHQSLQEREGSFLAHDQKINCGFINGPKGSPSTGFDLAEDDVRFMGSCHIAVSSCIFGNSDNLRTPFAKTVTRLSRKNVCFVMFMDEITLQTLSAEGQMPDRTGFIGLWKIVVVKNLPYSDMRRVGKIPKFLTHRLFPSARYSIWLDSKLRLQSDPLLILEYFLWRKGFEYAISNHYDRHCLWEEVAQNKKLNKFNHTIIDEQFAFYQADGLNRFNASDPNKLLPSNVPEGSFIMRAHTPMSNLFSCLWFNEVDRFTPRDQLSFAYTYLKLTRMNPGKPFQLNMFKDCERRAIAKLFHHRSEEKRNTPLQVME